jgi:integrase
MHELINNDELTLEQAFLVFQRERKISRKSINCYRHSLKKYFADWLPLPVSAITKEELESRRSELQDESIYVKHAFAVLTSILNFARGTSKKLSPKRVPEPTSDARDSDPDDPTLEEVLNAYTGGERLRPSSKKVYRWSIGRNLGDWLNLRFSEITPSMLQERRSELKRDGGVSALFHFEVLQHWAAKEYARDPEVKPIDGPYYPGDVTLRRVFEDYKNSQRLSKKTVTNSTYAMMHHLGDWMDRPVTEITKNDVQDRHRFIAGEAAANKVMRILRSVLNYAMLRYEDAHGKPILSMNPVNRLTEIKAWHKDKRRRGCVEPSQLRDWFFAVWQLESRVARDLLLLFLFTGMRYSEGATLTWSQVDLKGGTILIPAEKAKNRKESKLPMSDFVWKLLSERQLCTRGEYVFPGPKLEQPIQCIQKSIVFVRNLSGVHFMPHDLRRSFASFADDAEVPMPVVAQLLNHSATKSITESYTIRSIERLRRATQQITNRILHYLPNPNFNYGRATIAISARASTARPLDETDIAETEVVEPD